MGRELDADLRTFLGDPDNRAISDLAEILNQNDRSREPRDDLAERKEAERDREQTDDQQRDVREVAALVQEPERA